MTFTRIAAYAAAATSLWFGTAPVALSHTDLIVTNFGGTAARAQMLALIMPWEAETGKTVEMEEYGGGIDEIRRQVMSANVKWDVIDFDPPDLIRACEEGLLEKINPNLIENVEDFIPGAIHECGIGNVVWATVYAYNAETFDETTPTSIGDFFDLDAFPGKRGLWKTPRVALEWALMADGVAAEDIYTVLATPEGQDRAFAKLETIKSQIVWWSNGSQPAALLESGEVAMSAAWNGRLYQPMQDGVPIEIVWDGQLWEIDFFGIPKGSRRLEAALEFIKYATSEERMTEWSKLIPYGPSRASAAARVDDDIAPLLPTSEANTQNALRINSQWWAENINAIQPRFNAFIEENEVAEERGSRF
mgnify:FL=1